MTIACTICGREMHSLLATAKAQAHVLEQMSNHLGEHKHEAEELASIIAALSTYLLIRRYVHIPPGETDLRETFQQNEQALFDILELDSTAQN